MIKNKAFTLAEVLITLVIIGVIAVLTIPNLLQKYTEQVTVNKVKKFYSTLNDAFQQAIKENGNIENWGITGSNNESTEIIYKKLIEPYFKIIKDCGYNNEGDCIADIYYKRLDNKPHDTKHTNGAYHIFQLNDGSIVYLRSDKTKGFFVFYDINGKKEPNQWGKDLFDFTVTNNILTPLGTDISGYLFKNRCNKNSVGDGCAAWVIYKGNMDYLHCDDLSWDGKSKCSK